MLDSCNMVGALVFFYASDALNPGITVYYKLELRAIVEVEANLETSKK